MSNRRYNTQNIPSRMKFMGGGSSNKKLEQLKKLLAGQNKKTKQIKQKPSMMMVAMKGQK